MDLTGVISKIRGIFGNSVYNKLVNMSKEGLEKHYEDSRYGRSLARQAVVGINQIITSFDKFKETNKKYKEFRNASELEIALSFASQKDMPKKNYPFLCF